MIKRIKKDSVGPPLVKALYISNKTFFFVAEDFGKIYPV